MREKFLVGQQQDLKTIAALQFEVKNASLEARESQKTVESLKTLLQKEKERAGSAEKQALAAMEGKMAEAR